MTKRLTATILSVFLLAALATPALAQSVPERVYQPPLGPPEGRPVCGQQPDSTPCRPADVPVTHWAVNDILVLYDLGLLQGEPSGDFQPDSTMSTGEAVTLFLRVMGFKPRPGTADEHWADPALEDAAKAGLISQEDASNPSEPMSRLAVAVMLARALNPDPVAGSPPWSDLAGLSAEEQALLNALYHAGIFRGFPDGTFRPGEPLTRAQVATLVARILAAEQ